MKKSQPAATTTTPLKIVNGALMATLDQVQGRAAPILIVDCAGRQDIVDLFNLHRNLGRFGNSHHAWLRGNGTALEVYLRVNFKDPVETEILMKFDLPQDGILIEMILQAECFYFQSGKPGDTLLSTDGEPKILIEALSAGFEDAWHQLHLDLLASRFKMKGRSRAERIKMAEELINKMRSLSGIRIPQP